MPWFVTLLVGWGVGCGRDGSPPPTPPVAATPSVASKAQATSVETVRARSPFVGDRVCAECHAGLVETFHSHPMGRSLAPVAEAEPIERFDSAANLPFEAQGFRYEVRREGGRVWHVQTRLDALGAPVVSVAAEVAYSVGSGQQGRSYLIDRDGALFMSPLTWYPRAGRWDLSPGYEVNNSHFARPVTSQCLFCHCQFAAEFPHSVHRFEQPPFQGHAIGCERCHGPGAEHANHHERAVTGPDPIVNPGRLRPRLRDAVCEQCHLSGLLRVTRRGHGTFDFRPGTPLEDYLTVFVPVTQKSDDVQFVGHVEQMHASRCFTASDGRMGCTSCHDPHRTWPASERTAEYRRRCLSCHDEAPCRLATAERRARNDDCVGCHMPRQETEIRHAATTDHRIPRRPAPPSEPTPHAPPADGLPVRPFHLPDNVAVESFAIESFGGTSDPLRRDVGVGVLMLSSIRPELVRRPHMEQVLPLLAEATTHDARDWPAVEAFGHAQWYTGQKQAAIETLERLVAEVPQREFALDSLAQRCQDSGRHADAITYWRRAVEINPWALRYHLGLAVSLARLHRWPECQASAERTLTLQPANPGARQLLVECHLALGRFPQAEEEFSLLMRMQPPGAESLKRWFAEHPLRKK